MPVSDDSINLPSGSELLTGSFTPPAPTLTFALADSAVANAAASGSIVNTGSVAAGPWSIAAISGLTITPSSGSSIAAGATVTLSFTASAAGSYSPALTCAGAVITGNPQPITVTPAPSIVLSSSGQATVGVEYTVTVTAANLTGPLVVTPANVAGVATFNPTTATPAPGELVKLFGATWAAAGTHQIRATAPGGIVSNTLTVTAVAAPPPGPTTATLSVPANGTNSVAATVTITLDAPAGVGGRSFTLAATNSGTLGSTTVNIAQGATTGTTTITRSSSGTSQITMTGGGGLTLLGTPANFTSSPASSSQPFRVVRTGTRYATLAQAVAGAISGDTITVSPGTYAIPAGPGEQATPGNTWISGGINLNTLTIEWEVPGTRPVIDLTAFATAQASGGQPIGIHGGFNNRHLTVRGLELIGYPGGDSYGIYLSAGYPSGNPAASLTVEYCKLTRWADGVKTTYANASIDCDLRYTVFEDCTADGQTHGVYVQGDTVNALGCYFRTTVAGLFPTPSSAGHAIKSRMKVTNVQGCFFDMAGGVAALVEAPGGGQVTVTGNIMFAYNVGDPSNPPVKYGFEEVARQITVTLLAGAINVGDVLTGLTDEGVKSATVRVVKGGGTTLVYDVGSTGRFVVGATLTIAGVNRATVLTSTGSPDGDANDGRTHSLLVGQNTIWKEQPSAWAGTTMTAVGAVWVHSGMTDNQGDPITVTPTVRNNIIINNPGSATGCGARTLVDYPNNSAVASTTINTAGVYSGTPIAGSPAVNDAAYQYAGQFTPPLARTDTFRGGRIEGIPAWRSAMTTPLRWESLTPTATIGSLDPRLDGALNPNGAGNTPPWHAAGNTQATFLTAWGGGAYNRAAKKLKTAGGGHAGYSGNEVYEITLSAAAPTYTRLCPPSGSTPRPATFTGGYPNSGANNDIGTDSRPKSIHVYGVAAQDDAGRYFQMPGGAANDLSVGNVFTSRAFRLSGSDWDATSSAFSPTSSQPSTAVYDPDLDCVWCMWGTRTFRVDPDSLSVTNTYSHDGAPYYGTANYVSSNAHVLSFEGGQGGSIYLMVFATAAPGTFGYHRTGGGGGFVAIAGTAPPNPGSKYYASAWDSIRGRLLIYNGGSRMFTLTPPASGSWITGTWTWGELTCSTASYTPPADSGNGIFGRFFFDADYNCAICQPSDVTAPLIVLPLEA